MKHLVLSFCINPIGTAEIARLLPCDCDFICRVTYSWEKHDKELNEVASSDLTRIILRSQPITTLTVTSSAYDIP